MTDQKVLSKLGKLLAMAESARAIGSIAEAEAFATKVAELLAEHQIDMATVRASNATIDDTDPIDGGAIISAHKPSGILDWESRLAHAIGESCGCEFLVYGKAGLAFVGRREDRREAERQFDHFRTMALQLAEFEGRKAKAGVVQRCISLYGAGCFGRQSQAMKEWRESYIKGFSVAVSDRFRQALMAKRAAEAQTSTAMVWIRKDALAVRNFCHMKTKGRTANPKQRFSRNNSEAFGKGHSAGMATNLSGKVLA